MFNVWARALGLDVPGPLDEDEVMLGVLAVRFEVDEVTQALKTLGRSAELFQPHLERLRSLAGVDSLSAPWRGLAGNIIAPDVRLALRWAAETLPDDEEAADTEALKDLADEFDQLTATLATLELPPSLRTFATTQLRRLRSALRLYPIRGAAGLREAVEAAAGAYTVTVKHQAAAEPAPSTEGNAFLKRFRVALGKAADVTDKANKYSGAVIGLVQKGRQLIEWLSP